VTVGVAAIFAALALWSLVRTNETEVYSAALASFPSARPLLVSRPGTCGAGQHVPGIPDELMARFSNANGPDADAISLSRMRWDYDTTTLTKIDSYSVLAARAAAAKNGGTLLYLSRVGFNEQHSEAVFCLESTGGLLVYMRREHGEWRMLRTQPTWES
jgi:hypothetical protein